MAKPPSPKAQKHAQRWQRLRQFDTDKLADVVGHIGQPLKGVIGVDEVGRGSLVGPVVAAAVCLPHTLCATEHDWLLAIDDSKASHLNRAKRLRLKDAIQTHGLWGLGQASVEEIAHLNIVNASLLAGHRALAALAQQFDCDLTHYLTLMDGRHRIPQHNAPQLSQIKGDAHSAAIAAASIVAKAERDAMIDTAALQYPGYGWEQNAGYPTPAHQKAIAQLGVTPMHRHSYKTVQAACQAEAVQQTLS
ncbi:MAG: ribonuclease HII [Vampirovibrionales bacterium]